MAYKHFKDLPRRTASDKVLRDKAFSIADNAQYDGYQRGIASMVRKFFDKKLRDTTTHAGTRITFENKQLANELDKPIIRKYK